MSFRWCSVLLLLLSACVTTEPGPREATGGDRRFTHLQRAAALPWKDDGRCVVQEASQPWSVVVERCFHTLDTRRVQFRDIRRRCPVASADAASLETMVGICLLAQPELVVGAVVVLGTGVVAIAIAEELAEYVRTRHGPRETESTREPVKPTPQAESPSQEPSEGQAPTTEASPLGGDWQPPNPPEVLGPPEDRPECVPKRVPPKGGHPLHNRCADNIPFNDFRKANALVNGKAFDALQTVIRTLWEVKTHAIETYNPFIRQTELKSQVEEGRREKKLAAECGYRFVIGVRTEAHKIMLKALAPDLDVVLMPWCTKD